jgi:DHA3 family tetracycline resistance protein-like MFS transporter
VHHEPRRQLGAAAVYLIFSGAGSLFFTTIVTVNLVYQVSVAHLTPLQLVLVGTVLETTALVFQVPTGALADVFGRRLAVISGVVLIGLGFILEGSIPRFDAIVAGQALFGLGATLSDGAEQAWVSEEVGEERAGWIFVRGSQAALVGGLAGSVLSVALASIRLNLAIVVGGALYLALAAFLALFMRERRFERRRSGQTAGWRDLGGTMLGGLRLVRGRPILVTILLVALFFGLSSEGFDRLAPAHFLADFTLPTIWRFKPVVWFGVFAVAQSLLSLGMTEVVRRRLDMSDQRRLVRWLFAANAGCVVCVVAFGLAGSFALAVAAFLLFGTCRRVRGPLVMTWLTLNTEARSRATVISLSGQVDALGQIVGGPPVGYLGGAVSLRAAMVAVGAILSPVLLLLAWAARSGRAQPTPDAEEAVP